MNSENQKLPSTKTLQDYFAKTVTLLLVCLLVAVHSYPSFSEGSTDYPLIPYPTSLVPGQGSFNITAATSLVNSNPELFGNEVQQLQALFSKSFGKKLIEVKVAGKAGAIQLRYDAAIVSEEGYQLQITSTGVVLSASKPAGMFRGIETIRQLFPASVEGSQKPVKQLSLPALTISDAPVYAWRGMHIDVSRHFFTVDYLKKYIDRMALYKFNKLHIHLTDDQGWRIEIKKYPKLTSEGAWREFNNQDSACIAKSAENPDFALDPRHIVKRDGKSLYGGFYTQAQMKDIIAYAAARHIEIIPEIDMPGHMMAAIKSYPYLTCSGSTGWGKDFSIPVCPCKESTYQFAEDVFTEIAALFPSQYIHIGGDEVEKTTWATDNCKELMEKEGLKNVNELQSYFIRRMERFFNSKGKKLIGWDEILDGGVTSTAVVMYWRSWVKDAPEKAAKNNNKLIMSPVSNLYFDALPDKHSIKNVYNFNLVPEGLTAAQEKNIMGGQANLWSEMIPSENRMDYMVMPRMTALSEVLWGRKTSQYESYLQRLDSHYARLDAMGVHYRLPDLENVVEQNVFTDFTFLELPKIRPGYEIRYTADNSLPGLKSTLLKTPLKIEKPVTIRLAVFTPAGARGDVYTLNYEKQSYANAVTDNSAKPGLNYRYYAKLYPRTTAIGTDTPSDEKEVKDLNVPASADAPSFGIRYKGYLAIPETGIYSFFLTADDGAVLRIAGKKVVDNDGQHHAIEKSGQAALQQGLQFFELDFIEGGGGYKLELTYSINGSKPVAIPDSWFKH